jgi:NADH-quinone oxidoreductase subunit M
MPAWAIYVSFIGAIAITISPGRSPLTARITALVTTLLGLGIAIAAMIQNGSGQLVTITRKPWIPTLGIEYHLAADGISLVMILLTGIAAVAGVLFSWNIEKRVREFFALYLVLIGAVYGVFLSFDLFDLFVFYEIAIIPKYFLIAIWGSTRREYAAMKLVLYSFAGSALVLAGLIAAYIISGARTLRLEDLASFPFPAHFQMWAFPLVFVGFAVLAGMWPFHTWAPTGHAAAPTAASMLLAGVIMKLGAYGCLRVAMTLFPRGLDPWGFHVLGFGSWRQVFAVLAVAGIVYGASIALVQKDLKFVVGYSSVSHMGFVLLGLMTLNQIGLSGSIYQMFSHGIIAGLLFAVVGRMVYDRTHTRDLAELSRIPLARMIPFAAVTFVLAFMASVGMPGFSGFIAELEVLIGGWRAFPWMSWIAALGILIGIAFSWRALEATFFGEAGGGAEILDHGGAPAEPMPAITLPERLGACILLASTIALGLYPKLLMGLILPALHGPLFEQLRRDGWR